MHFVTCDLTKVQHCRTFNFELPWPHKDLSPNSRGHWSKTARHKRAYRARCRAIAEQAGVGVLAGAKNAVRVDLTFFPPDARRRDMDNMLASMKSGLDGLADAMGVDDWRWQLSFKVDEPVKGGVVVVEITEGT